MNRIATVHGTRDATREAAAELADLQEIIERLQREARSDARLRGRLIEPDLDRLVDQHVRALWAESRVTAFVPLLAMRRMVEELGVADRILEVDPGS